MSIFADSHTARAFLRIGQRVSGKAEVVISTAGLLAVAVLVSGILLSTAVVVAAAGRTERSKRLLK